MIVKRRRIYSQDGAILPFAAISTVFLLIVVGFVLDLSRYETAIRRAQHAADEAALSGVLRLETRPINSAELATSDFTAEIEVNDFADVKKAVLLSLSQADLIGLNEEAQASLCSGGNCAAAIRFNDPAGAGLINDCPNYNSLIARAGNLVVRTERMIQCYWQDPDLDPASAPIERVLLSVEGSLDHYCKANAVRVDIEIQNQPTTFTRLIGFDSAGSIRVFSTSFMQEPIPAPGEIILAREAAGGAPLCASVSCDSLGIRNLLETDDIAGLDPCIPGITPCQCNPDEECRPEIGIIRCPDPTSLPNNC